MWSFDLNGIAQMYQSYENTSLWNFLRHPHVSSPPPSSFPPPLIMLRHLCPVAVLLRLLGYAAPHFTFDAGALLVTLIVTRSVKQTINRWTHPLISIMILAYTLVYLD